MLPACTLGSKGSVAGQFPSPTWNRLWLTTGAPPLHGVSTLRVMSLPHSIELASTARGPPLKRTFMLVNGSCGNSAKEAVTCPVCGSRRISPGSLTCTPRCELALSTIRNSCSGVEVRT